MILTIAIILSIIYSYLLYVNFKIKIYEKNFHKLLNLIDEYNSLNKEAIIMGLKKNIAFDLADDLRNKQSKINKILFLTFRNVKYSDCYSKENLDYLFENI